MTAEPERRRRGIYEIGDSELARLLQLGAGQHVVSVNTSWERLSLMVMVEGPGLPECAEGNHPVVLNRWGRFRPLALLDVSKLSPGAAHAAVLAELAGVRFEDPAALAGRARILDRHAPDAGGCEYWPCEDYLDAAAGLVAGLPGQAEHDAEIAAYAAAAEHAQLLEQFAPGVMTREQALRVLSDAGAGAKLDALVLGDQGAADPTRTDSEE